MEISIIVSLNGSKNHAPILYFFFQFYNNHHITICRSQKWLKLTTYIRYRNLNILGTSGQNQVIEMRESTLHKNQKSIENAIHGRVGHFSMINHSRDTAVFLKLVLLLFGHNKHTNIRIIWKTFRYKTKSSQFLRNIENYSSE